MAQKSKVSSSASLVFDKPVLTKKGNHINLDAFHLFLKPNEKQSIYVSMRTLCPEKVEEFFEILVKDGNS